MAADTIEVLDLARFRFVNLAWCKAVHSTKARGAIEVEAEQALDKDGNLKPKFERILDEEKNETGYALRGDSPVYEQAEECLKEGIEAARECLDEICFKIEGGALVLPSDNYAAWDKALVKIATIVSETNRALDSMRVSDDPGSPLINDLLRERKKGKGKPMSMDWTPLLHPELVVSSDEGQDTVATLARTAMGQVNELVQAIENKDAPGIARLTGELRNVDRLFKAGDVRDRVKDVIEGAREIKTTIEAQAHAARMAERADGDLPRQTQFVSRSADAVKARVIARTTVGQAAKGLGVNADKAMAERIGAKMRADVGKIMDELGGDVTVEIQSGTTKATICKPKKGK